MQMIQIRPDDLRDLCADRIQLYDLNDRVRNDTGRQAERETAREYAERDLATSQIVRRYATEGIAATLKELGEIAEYSRKALRTGPGKDHLVKQLGEISAKLDDLRGYIQV